VTLFPPGPAHTNGTRLLAKPGTLTKIERGTGLAAGSLRGQEAPDFAGGGARCVVPEVDPDLFSPTVGTPAETVDETIATYCAPCPMRAACLAWGRKAGRGQGVWGGVWLDDPKRNRRAS
jgi:hypothetical protein